MLRMRFLFDSPAAELRVRLQRPSGMQIVLASDSTTSASVLVLTDLSPEDATSLLHDLRGLAAGTASLLTIAERTLGGHVMRLIARVATTDAGCHLGNTDPAVAVIYCDLTPGTWGEVTGLLAPFSRSQPTHAHQYLSDQGALTWIVSTDSTW